MHGRYFKLQSSCECSLAVLERKPFKCAAGCVIEKHASVQTPFARVQHSSSYTFGFSLPYQLRGAVLLSCWSLAQTHTQKITGMNRSELQRGFFEFETGALQNLSNEQAKSSLEESPSTRGMSEAFGNEPKWNIINRRFNETIWRDDKLN